MVTNNLKYRWDFIGLSTETKPTPENSNKVVDGSTFFCTDTSKLYVFCKDNWYEKKPLGGGGGGGTSDFNQLTNRPKYNGAEMSSSTNIPTVPTNTNQLTNGAGFITKSVNDLTNYTTTTNMNTALEGKQATLVSGTNIKTVNNTTLLGSGNVAVQPTLVSGTNIKTINGNTLLGSGDLTIQGGGTVDTELSTTSENPVQNKAIATAINGKQATLVSGTNIKTINSTSLLGSGNVAVQPTLVSGTNIKTVNSTSLLGSGNVAVQPTLVSGTNIKTINSTSLLGSGDIALQPAEDSGWQTLTNTTADVSYRKKNGIVFLQLSALKQNTTVNVSGAVLGTLPAGFRPSAVSSCPFISNTGELCDVRVGTDGQVSIRHFGTSTVTINANDWLAGLLTYIGA